MNRLLTRLREQVDERAKLPTLSTALFGTRSVAYAARRSGFAFGRSLLTAFFHALEATALALYLDSPFLTAIVTVRLVSSFASGAIWGITEPLRMDVRTLLENRDMDGARTRIEVALSRAFWGSLACFAVGLAWVIYFPFLRRGVVSVVDAYAVALALKVALSLWTRTYASGINATRRVARPRWSMLLPDFLDVAGLFLFWRWAGPWSIAISLPLSSILQAILTRTYARRAYLQTKYTPHASYSWTGLLPDSQAAARATISCIAWFAFELPTMFLLGVWSQLGLQAGGLLLYAVRPIANFLLGIPRLYYIDIVSVRELGLLGMKRLARHIRKFLLFGWAIIVVALLAAGIAGGASGSAWLLAAFALFLFASAIFGFDVLRNMVLGKAGRAAVSVAIPSAALLGARILDLPPALVLFAASIHLFVSARWLASERGQPDFELGQDVVFPLPVWISRTTKRNAPTTIAVLRIGEEIGGHSVRFLARHLALSSDIDVARIGHRFIVVAGYTTQRDAHRFTQEACGLATVDTLQEGVDGLDAFHRLAIDRRFPSPLREALDAPRLSPQQLLAWVRQHVPTAVPIAGPTGRCLDAVGSLGTLRSELHRLMGHRPPGATEWGAYDLALYAPEGVPRLLVCCPRSTPAEVRSELRTKLWYATIAAALRRG